MGNVDAEETEDEVGRELLAADVVNGKVVGAIDKN